MERRRDHPPKIIGLIDLYAQHPEAVTTRLLEFGLEWRRAGELGNTWDLMVAVCATEPPWGPINRAQAGDDWVWYLPGFDSLQTLTEATVLSLYQRAHKKATDFKRAKRPWEKVKRKLKAAVMPIEQFDDFFKSRFSQSDETE